MQTFNINPTARDPQTAAVQLPAGQSGPRFAPGRQLRPPSFWTNLKDFLTERSVRLPRNAQQDVFRNDGLDTSFAESFRAFFRPLPEKVRPPMALYLPEWSWIWSPVTLFSGTTFAT
jgi:hypothetical protein